jgi:hypothetical protein
VQDIPFQLSSRAVTFPIEDGKKECFAIQAIVVEALVENIMMLCERFFSSGDPALVKKVYPYVGKYPFIPLLKSHEWPVQKIWQLAKLHDHKVFSLHPIFLHNLQDLNDETSEDTTLRAAFFIME